MLEGDMQDKLTSKKSLPAGRGVRRGVKEELPLDPSSAIKFV
jgi:hypothetical protein